MIRQEQARAAAPAPADPKAVAEAQGFRPAAVSMMTHVGRVQAVAEAGELEKRLKTAEDVLNLTTQEQLALGPLPASKRPRAYSSGEPAPPDQQQAPTFNTGQVPSLGANYNY